MPMIHFPLSHNLEKKNTLSNKCHVDFEPIRILREVEVSLLGGGGINRRIKAEGSNPKERNKEK